MPERLLYPLTEAAVQLGIGRTLLYEEIAEGRIETVTIGRKRLVPRQALVAYVERLRDAAEAGS